MAGRHPWSCLRPRLVRAVRDSSVCSGLGIDIGVWADEECHFLQFLGSRSFIDTLDEQEINSAVGRDGETSLREALARAGYLGRRRQKIDPSRYVGYLEAHVEQGDVLDSSGLRIGIVTGIVGLSEYRIASFGEQNHAGTTRMAARRDAGHALIRVAEQIDKVFADISGPRSVWTIGQIRFSPGSPSIIPGYAEMVLQFRDECSRQLERFETALQQIVAEASGYPCRCTYELVYTAAPKPMHRRFLDALEKAAKLHAAGSHVRMPSGATHDAQIIADRLPAGMLFVPSIGGISHHFTENTAEADIILGCQVLATAAEDILIGSMRQ